MEDPVERSWERILRERQGHASAVEAHPVGKSCWAGAGRIDSSIS